jgi:hypothetical protein
MTLMVRDEADIIEDNLHYHRAQGVDFFVVADTGSSDGTLEILETCERAGILRLERTPSRWRNAAEEGEIQTLISRVAWEMDADWVIHNDSDEFWWPLTGNLKEALASIPERFGLVLVPRTEFVGRPGDGFFADRLTVRETRFRRPPRAAHRAHPQVSLWTTHPIDVWIDRGETPRQGLVGRPALRSQATHVEERELELVLAPRFPIGIFHFPIRSFDQYRKKVGLVAEAGRFRDEEESREVETAYESGELERVYRSLTLSDEEVARGIDEGWLVEDGSFRDYLLACPGLSDDADPPPGASSWSEARREAALAELEADAAYSLSRYMQTVAYKKQSERRQRNQRVASLRAELKRKRRQLARKQRALARERSTTEKLRLALEAERARPWARLRRAIRRRGG